MLYIVATPIGNLEDLTFRALRVLKKVDIIFAEDTRVTGKLLAHYEINTPMRSYHQHSSESTKEEILEFLLQGKDVALVTDAGTPGISDPGNELLDFIYSRLPSSKFLEDSADLAAGIFAGDDLQIQLVSPIPGPSALTTAISVGGFNMSKFLFLGFLPKRKRKKLFGWIQKGEINFAFYESPYRLIKSLESVGEAFGWDIRVVVSRELTKLHESVTRGNLEQVLDKLKNQKIQGEVVVLVEVK